MSEHPCVRASLYVCVCECVCVCARAYVCIGMCMLGVCSIVCSCPCYLFQLAKSNTYERSFDLEHCGLVCERCHWCDGVPVCDGSCVWLCINLSQGRVCVCAYVCMCLCVCVCVCVCSSVSVYESACVLCYC